LGINAVARREFYYQTGGLAVKLPGPHFSNGTAYGLAGAGAAQLGIGQVDHDARGVDQQLRPRLYLAVSGEDQLISLGVKRPVL
jgi:hypothetical protein